METVVVTGGAGMIGSNLVNRLSEQGVNVFNIDNLSGGGMYSNLTSDFKYCDVSNREKLFSLLSDINPTLIFHCAAHFANQNSVDYPRSDINDNVIALVNILDFAKLNDVKVVYASSSCVYGQHADSMTETSVLHPYDTPYAINKYAGELYCTYYSNTFGVKTNVVRIFNSYGPGELPGKYRNVIPNFIKAAVKGEDICITGTGEEVRDFTYVDDTVALLTLAARSEYWNADIFNGGTGRPTRILDLAEMIIKVTESKSKIKFLDSREWDHVKTRLSDISKSREMLHYHPNESLASGVLKTYQWLLPHLE